MSKRNPWVRVTSTAVIALCWEQDGEVELIDGSAVRIGTLYVCYVTGDVYRYHQISEHDYNALLAAKSVGRAVNVLLKPSRRAVYVYKLSKQAMEQLNGEK